MVCDGHNLCQAEVAEAPRHPPLLLSSFLFVLPVPATPLAVAPPAALPPTATLSVSLQDVSLADAPAVTLAEQKGPVKGQVPLPFHLSYDPAQVKPGHSYSVSARIEVDGQLMFITTERHSVQLNGQDPQPLRLRVDAVAH